MKTRSVLLSLALLAAVVPAAWSAAPNLETEEQKVLYAVGLAMSGQLRGFDLTAEELRFITAGVEDGATGSDPKVALEEYGPRIDPFLQARMARSTEREQKAGEEFRKAQAAMDGARTTDSGLIYFEETVGTGDSPTDESTVKVNYRGTFRDGKVFDTSIGEAEPASFALNQVFPCFAEGLRLMRVGGKSKLVCPPELAYGDRGFPPLIPPASTLVFEVELLEVAAATPDAAVEPATPDAPAPMP